MTTHASLAGVLTRRLIEVAVACAIALIAIVGLSIHSGVFTLVAAQGADLDPSVHDGDLVLAVRGTVSSARPGQIVAVHSTQGFSLATAASTIDNKVDHKTAMVAARVLPHLGGVLLWLQGAFVRFVLAACMPLALLLMVARSSHRPRTVGDRRPVLARVSVASCPVLSSSSSPRELIVPNERPKVSPSPQLRVLRELASVSG